MHRTLPAVLLALCLCGAAHAPAIATRHLRPAAMAETHHAAQAVPVAAPPPAAVLAPLAPWLGVFHRQAQATGVPQAALEAVALVESGGNPAAVSSVGALGLMQVRPMTGMSVGVWGLQAPVASITAGARYLARLGRRYGVTAACWAQGAQETGACAWRVDRVLSAYAAGPGATVLWYCRRVRRDWVAVEGAVA